ncbi:phosphinothricin acetyltransferase [Actinomadura meyerae]|jgi:phosphinothricin acetyltransferase|uniref:Phosphinothricin acetyltransferase n=1 Tax=Actinomadura meyerae TaxID=240840 RepID=A0A239EXH0_9ACTN|nr:GNAT family N-acetyltransferase [Actinomadura meyerae]SNS49287.1 phosphinothricin acetyltransferase [Actinomadura meyerae]
MSRHQHHSAGIAIRSMEGQDADQVLTIYQQGLDTGNASFETTAPTWDEFDAAKLDGHRFVATDPTAEPSANLLGWIAATRVSERCCYAGVVEHSIYISPHARGLGIGAALLTAFIASTEADDIWTVQTGIFPENTPSLRLHAKAGFRTVGIRQRLGRLHGRWRDVVLLERRSPIVL